VRLEVAIDEIAGRDTGLVPDRGAGLLAAMHPLEVLCDHEAGDPLASAADALSSEGGVDARSTIGAARCMVDLLYQQAEAGVANRPVGWLSGGPLIDAAARDLEHLTHDLDREVRLLRFDETMIC
jgi:hypothetical protein